MEIRMASLTIIPTGFLTKTLLPFFYNYGFFTFGRCNFQRKNIILSLNYIMIPFKCKYCLPSFLLSVTSESVESKGSFTVAWDDWSWQYTGNKVASTEQREGGRKRN